MGRPRKSKRKLKVIDLIIIIVIIIIIAVIGVRKITSKKSGEQNTQTVQQQENELNEQYVKILEDGSKLNISTKLKENKKIDNIENIVIKDIQLMYKDGVTNILATVENTGSTKLDATKLEITLLDDKGETVYKMQGLIEETEAGGTSKLNSSITADFANVYDFKVVKK